MATSGGFASAVAAWSKATEARLDEVFKLSFSLTVQAVQDLTPVKSGFLRGSLTVTIGEIAHIDPAATGGEGSAPAASAATAIAAARLGDRLSAGFTAAYAPHVEYGVAGRQPARAMVRLGVQRFPELVAQAVRRAGG